MTGKITWLDADTPLPPARDALTDPDGLLAAGLDLNTSRLEEAYKKGIFPWFNPGDPVLWWSPNPRTVLFSDELHLSKSLRKRLRQIERSQTRDASDAVIVTVDCCFTNVMQACAQRVREPSAGTWITTDMLQVYKAWHQQGRAHSIETWMNGQLAGGLYGISIGTMFYGESMFSLQTDASKIALVHLLRFLQRHGVTLIDCQMATTHLMSMGAREVDRDFYIEHVRTATQNPDIPWATGRLDLQGQWYAECPEFTRVISNP